MEEKVSGVKKREEKKALPLISKAVKKAVVS